MLKLFVLQLYIINKYHILLSQYYADKLKINHALLIIFIMHQKNLSSKIQFNTLISISQSLKFIKNVIKHF